MSLMQLLAVGQSLRPIKDRPSRYRMRQQSLLPKFGPAASSTQLPAAIGPAPGPPAPAAPPTDTGAVSAGKPDGAPALKPPGGPAPGIAAAAAQAYPAGRWLSRSWTRFTRAASNPPRQVPVQGELSLESVRPVRNDLTDSDLEVVPAVRPSRVGQGPRPSGPEPSLPPARPQSPLWHWLRRRLLQRLD